MQDAFEHALILITPVAWISAWWFLIGAYKREPRRWRIRLSFTSLALLTIAGLLFIPIAIYNSGVDWKSGEGIETHMRHTLLATAVAIRICGAALLLSLFGKPKLVALIVVACIGTALFWVVSTIP